MGKSTSAGQLFDRMQRDGGAISNPMNNISQQVAEAYYSPLPVAKATAIPAAAQVPAALAASAKASPPNDSPNGLQPGGNGGGFDGFSGRS